MKKLLLFLALASAAFGQHQSVTVLPDGKGDGTFNTAGINYYYGGANTFDFTNSTLVGGGFFANGVSVNFTVPQANSFVAGQPVTINSSGVWIGASANSTLLASNALGIVSSLGLSASSFNVVMEGTCVVAGGSFTPSTIYYVPLSAGVVTSTAPSTIGQYVYPVATSVSATVLNVALSTPSIVVALSSPLTTNNTWTGTNTFNNTVNGTGITSLFSSPSAIGATAPATGQFTNIGIGVAAPGTAELKTGGTLLSSTNYDLYLSAVLDTNTNGTTQYGGYISNTLANGANNNIGYTAWTIVTPTVTGDALTSGYMLNIQAPASGMTGAINVASGANNLGTGTTTVGSLSTPGQMTSTATTGTAPLVIASTTTVPNLSVNVSSAGDYSSGSWTPVLNSFTIVNGTGSVTTSGTYVKIGHLVFANAIATVSGTATIAAVGSTSNVTGFPYTPVASVAGTFTIGLGAGGGVFVLTGTGGGTLTCSATSAANSNYYFTAIYAE
jgi:hypothetical protein